MPQKIELKPCPFCGHEVIEKIAGGVHFYECRYARCGACISFVGSKPVGYANGIKMFEAENPRERFNRRCFNEVIEDA